MWVVALPLIFGLLMLLLATATWLFSNRLGHTRLRLTSLSVIVALGILLIIVLRQFILPVGYPCYEHYANAELRIVIVTALVASAALLTGIVALRGQRALAAGAGTGLMLVFMCNLLSGVDLFCGF